ncbi:MAG: AMP-binding protein [Verrucomicrobia bacterium]|nr:AMP-binding protein [Verrucomicrobiota bacterium]
MNLTNLSIQALLSDNAENYGDNPAILSEAFTTLSHRDLFRQFEASIKALNKFGVGRNDRVAIVLPQSPELAVAFLCVAGGATAAPLNYSYKEADFRFYLEDLQACALIVLQGDSTPARVAASSLQVPVIELVPDVTGNGRFELSGIERALKGQGGFAEPEDVGLILHTSGTTSRPKIVPLTQANLCISAQNIVQTVQLQSNDRCLNVMPLFHIHGIVACILASLGGGGSTVCTRAFEAGKFFGWLRKFKPTWYSAVPTMHQAILGQSDSETGVESSLRFIRSSSAALPPPVMEDLEQAFSVPVIESYGMTEAAHQMASNPLPPQARKPGSVGLAAGPEVCILGDSDEILASGEIGEISIRGTNVTSGYENNPEANISSFTSGWFRTGDQGYLDTEGYLFLTGRLKEMINRGGENIAPREIDEALLTHAEVRQAVGFAMPHPSLGEDVAAAVILKEGSTLNEADLRKYALEKLPDFKAPSRIVILDDIPKGPTGKLQRIGLAEKLAEALKVTYEAPSTETERLVSSTIEEVLDVTRVGRNHNFFDLGGDSLRALQVLSRVKKTLGLETELTLLFRLPTPALLAEYLDELVFEHEIEMLAEELNKLSSDEQADLLEDKTSEYPKN